ncbi:VanZ family protein [Saccharopolyspora sp. 7B]|uniref:VanZ family protein n=1 Tax=Saccharopolyspora sp. 7B TaxID=2877240 RepID=UPI001CD76D4A|nr:VanZ family protein [Saccharopolyspora sp. 7B]MCA1281039.1 VanZ family protein [Saccharopolyspora sp. 7B]
MYQLFMAFDGFVPALTVLFPLAVLVAAVSGTVRSNRLRSVSPLHDPLIDALLVFAVLFTGYLVFYPQPEIADRVEMELGNDLYTALRAAPGDIRPWVQLGGNLMLLIPMATLVPLRVRWFDGFGKIVIGGLLTALTIETIQFFCIPGRVASTDDVVLNTLGAAAGGVVVCASWRRAEAQLPGPNHRSAEPDDAQTTVWRIIEKIEQERRPEAVPEGGPSDRFAGAARPARGTGAPAAPGGRAPHQPRLPANPVPGPATPVRAAGADPRAMRAESRAPRPAARPVSSPGRAVPAAAGRTPTRSR